jgi:hypothetical protein
MAGEIDLTKASHQELQDMHSAVLRQIAIRTVGGGGEGLSPQPHDSHSSSHSKNTIVFTPGQDITNPAVKVRPEKAGP